MARNQLDSIDAIAAPIFMLGSLTSLGLLSVGSLPIIGDPASAIWSAGSAELSIGVVLSVLALGWVAATNEWSFSGASTAQTWAVTATVGLLLAPPWFPVVADLISTDLGAIAALATQTTGYAVVSYLG